MDYLIYTFPNCDKCHEVKKILEKKDISYEEINAGLGIGKKKFLEFYKDYKDNIERDEKGGIILPVLVCDSKILQGLEKIVGFLNEN